jgi:hypothetical protein
MSTSADVTKANRKPFWSKAGEAAAPAQIPTQADSGGSGGGGVLNPHNNDRASRIPNRQPDKTQFHRGQQKIDAGGARLSISPSDKIPTDELPSGYNHSPKLVQSRSSGGKDVGNGSAGLFTEAQYSSQRL